MTRLPRDPAKRDRYLHAALADIPRLLGAIDRNPFRPTYGCLDRQYWHYRTSCFPSEMYQEGVLALALVFATPLPGNRWHGIPRVRDLAIAGIRFSVQASHADGSCDDYYPFERALGAAVFSLQAAARAYEVLGLDDHGILEWFHRRGRWLIEHGESGRLTNHHALAALGLLRVAQITACDRYREAAGARIRRVLQWQDEEGWFEEYGGADPGYQTVTIDSLAKCRKLTGDRSLDAPLHRAVEFARLFLHPDQSFGGEYGSRGTHHFYPHGMELLAAEHPAAAQLADGFLASLAAGRQAHFADDRLFAHRLANLLEAYLDWSPDRPGEQASAESLCRYLPHAQLLVRQTADSHTVVSAARGGIFRHFAGGELRAIDTGLVVETSDGRVAASQWHASNRSITVCENANGMPSNLLSPRERPGEGADLTVAGPLHWCRMETATPVKQSLLHVGMWSVGRWCRGLVRWVLQQRLITGRREAPVRLTRKFEFLDHSMPDGRTTLRVTDTIELTDPRVQVRRMGFGVDHQFAYVAACGVYQESVLLEATDLAEHVPTLNAQRRIVIVRDVQGRNR